MSDNLIRGNSCLHRLTTGLNNATLYKEGLNLDSQSPENKIRILFADDDADTRYLVGRILQKAGMCPILAENGYQALELWRNTSVDLIILDCMMPVVDGLEVCQRIRQVSDVPIILLTARGCEQDVVDGFGAGADDYVIKPFRTGELVARIHAILHRAARQHLVNDINENQLVFEDLALDVSGQRIANNGKMIYLSPLEFRLLQYLMQHTGCAVSKQDLLYEVWGFFGQPDEINFIEAAIKRLRKKIEPDPTHPQYIHTVWGKGYRFGR